MVKYASFYTVSMPFEEMLNIRRWYTKESENVSCSVMSDSLQPHGL